MSVLIYSFHSIRNNFSYKDAHVDLGRILKSLEIIQVVSPNKISERLAKVANIYNCFGLCNVLTVFKASWKQYILKFSTLRGLATLETI
jgi:hypothetical protein